MPKAKAADVVRAALGLIRGSLIPYHLGGTSLEGMDCRGLVLYCVRQAGGKLSYSGSNAMYRACYKAGRSWPLADARKFGKLVPGALVFMVERDGGEGAQYKADGLGNASHVGVYVGESDAVWSIDASESAGKVRTRPAKDATRLFTHVGWLPEIDYTPADTNVLPAQANSSNTATTAMATDTTDKAEPNIASNAPLSGDGRQSGDKPAAEDSPPWSYAIVTTPNKGALNLRRDPTDMVDNRIGKIPNAACVAVLDSRGQWRKVAYAGATGWVMAQYLLPMEA